MFKGHPLKVCQSVIKFFRFSLASAFFLILTSSFSWSATIEYTYDDLWRLITVIYSNDDRIDYTYDDAGNRLTQDIDDTGGSFPTSAAFVISGGNVSEGGNITFTISKQGTTSLSHNVDYGTLGNTATQGIDYTGKSGTLTFTSTQTQKTVVVTTTEDTDVESVESFYMDLSNPTNGAVINTSRATGNILNDDVANSPPNARIFNILLVLFENRDVCVTCGADPDGDEATVKSISGTGATITLDDKKVNVTAGIPGTSRTINYTIEDPGGLEDSSVINVETADAGNQ